MTDNMSIVTTIMYTIAVIISLLSFIVSWRVARHNHTLKIQLLNAWLDAPAVPMDADRRESLGRLLYDMFREYLPEYPRWESLDAEHQAAYREAAESVYLVGLRDGRHEAN